MNQRLNLLVLGNGGREHALVWKLAQSNIVDKIYVCPGNGGTNIDDKVINVAIGCDKGSFTQLAEFAVNNDVSMVIPGPEQPLVDGVEAVFRKRGIPVFGPSAAAAQMEGSKTFSKDFMKKYDIPTAAFENFSDFDKAKEYVEAITKKHKVVIKASGLAAGKGVLMPETTAEAVAALEQIMKVRDFGSAGDEVVVEQCLEGYELSILAFSDGYTVVDLPPAQDHKRIGEGDTGLNTGGMGTYAPTPAASPELLSQIRKTILQPTVDGMRKDGIPFVGMLFVGIMVTADGPQVLEYNVRFGDPETQSVLLLLETDLAEIMWACTQHYLDAVPIKIRNGYAATVVMSAGGYPLAYRKGDRITIQNTDDLPDVHIFHAGTKESEGAITTAGGRVIAASAFAPTLKGALDLVYQGVDRVSFEGKYFRKDIAHRALKAAESGPSGAAAVTYEAAGVSVDRGNQFVEQIKACVKSTRRTGADADIGGFGGIFDLKAANFADPLIVSATDGVGTKLKIAHDMNIHDTVGIDLVGMNVNDLVVQGAEPLFFLDYFASGKLDISVAADFVKGVADGCIQAGCALVGGETAEMPGLYKPGDYDVNGTSVGAVERNAVLPKIETMVAGDVLLGLQSNGVHSNGFSLVRKILEVNGLKYTDSCPWSSSKATVGEDLLTPTRIYVKPLLQVLRKFGISALKGMAHITGGGLVENVPRALPKKLDAEINGASWTIPPAFHWLGKAGNVPKDDLVKTLNMGIGMVLIVSKEAAQDIKSELESLGETVFTIGQLKSGSQKCTVSNMATWY